MTEDGTSVVLACYFESGEAARVQAQMLQNGVETAISERLSDAVVLSGEAARYSEAIAGNLQTADACARILYHAANGLERAAIGQNEASALLGFVASSLRGLPQGNSAQAFAPWNAALIHLADEVRSLTDGILFARDVRRAQVELCLQVVQAEKYFS